jgi:phage shock protein PspC (stress-responsive transcriptional regulator)
MKKLYRSENDSKIAGICGGIGEEFGVDCNIVRLGLLLTWSDG